MKRILLYILGAILLLIILGAIFGLTYVSYALPDVGPPEDISIEVSPDELERGEYLANHVALCTDCHAERDFSYFAGPIIEGTKGAGGEVFDQKMDFPGKFVSPNITPHETGIGQWTDGEVLQAVTEGVNKEGKALFPIMPYPHYGSADIRDIYAIIAYIRTLDPVDKVHEESTADFPMNFIINTIPQDADFSERPDPSDKVAYGEYVFKMASCTECHTQMEAGEPLEGMFLAGGFEIPMPTGGIVRSANITPHKETGIGKWSKEKFIGRFKQYTDSNYVNPKVKSGTFNTFMPWLQYSEMKEEDLSAIYAYLMTVEPVENEVEKFTPPSEIEKEK